LRIIGLSGGIGAGKSTVARMLKKLGAVVIDADKIGHQVLKKTEVIEKIRRRWGSDVLNRKGEVDRKKLARAVFDDEAELKALQRIVHPLILREIRKRIEEFREESESGVIVLDAPLLHETKLDALCDAVIYVEANRRARANRLKEERGWRMSEVLKREKFQLKPSQKRRLADYIVRNSGSLEETFRQVEELWKSLTQTRKR